jgi:hypothetical protein
VGHGWCQREQQRQGLVRRFALSVWWNGSCAIVGLPTATCGPHNEEPQAAAPWTMPPLLCAACGAQLSRYYHGAARAAHLQLCICCFREVYL